MHCTVSLCFWDLLPIESSMSSPSTTSTAAASAGVRASPLLMGLIHPSLPSSPPVDRSSPSTNRKGDGQVSSTIYSSDKSRIMSAWWRCTLRTCWLLRGSQMLKLGPCLDPKLLTLALCKKKILRRIKLAVHVWSTKCRWNQKLIAQFGWTLRDESFEPN